MSLYKCGPHVPFEFIKLINSETVNAFETFDKGCLILIKYYLFIHFIIFFTNFHIHNFIFPPKLVIMFNYNLIINNYRIKRCRTKMLH